jgi:hypothetical protein
MTTAKELYTNLLPFTLASYAATSYDVVSAKQMADALARDCVNECARLGLLEDQPSQAQQSQEVQAPQFSAAEVQPMPNAQPNFATGQPIGGQQIIPPVGAGYSPPVQAGVMGTVVQVPTPQGHSALGTDAVISQPTQRPNTQDQVVAPSNQLVVQQAGGAGTQYVPERIVR